MTEPDVIRELYQRMFRSRVFEQTINRLWNEGLISGELHSGMGEEAICAGIDLHLEPGDALALDHRGTVPLLMRGCDPQSLILELLGHPDGLCAGYGGHMHLFDQSVPAVSSGIVGAAGPAASGFALAAKYLHTGKISVAYFGEAAVNQGMLMESFNLAVAWNLPVLFVCKDNNWSITTRSADVTGGNITERAASFGLNVAHADGFDVMDVHKKAGDLIASIRAGGKPAFLHATCVHLEGHFLGDPLLRFRQKPFTQMRRQGIPMAKSAAMPRGAPFKERMKAIKSVLENVGKSVTEHFSKVRDPLNLTRRNLILDESELLNMEARIKEEIKAVTEKALNDYAVYQSELSGNPKEQD